MKFKDSKLPIILILLLIIFFIVVLIMPNQLELFIFRLSKLFEGKIWTLFTATFITTGLIELLVNIIFLWTYSLFQVKRAGSLHTLIIFAIGQILGFLVLGFILRNLLISIAGPGGGIAALFGSILIINREAIKKSLFLKILIIISIISLILSPLSYILFGNLGFIGSWIGLISGILYSLIIKQHI